MADVTLTYKGSTILSLENSATKTIKTGGKFCEGDIGVNYVSPKKINRNLLDNAYFVGGGSQLGDGVLPINQRGQTTYSGSGYVIDGWRNHQNANCAVTLNANGVTVQNASSTSRLSFRQYLYNEQYLYGKIVTGTILLTDGAMCTGSVTLPNSRPNPTQYGSFTSFNGHTLRIALNASGPWAYEIMVKAKSTVSIAAIKLELGSEQTLAHNEGTEANPVWVLNEVPDYGEELRKCQRYYQLFRTESLRPTYGEDCRPTMATEQPTKGTLTKGGVTYYTLSSEY